MNSKDSAHKSLANMTTHVVEQTTALLCVWFLVQHLLPASAGQTDSQELDIVVLQGDGATHMVNYRHFEEPIVEVRRSGRPVKVRWTAR